MKKTVLEELNRVRLLMAYDSKKTLSENIEIVKLVESKEIISEQTAKSIMNALLGTTDEATALALKAAGNKNWTDAIKFFDDVSVGGLSTSDDIMTALIKNTITKNQLSELAKGLMKKGNVTGTLRTKLTDKASKLAIRDANYVNMSEVQFKKALIKKGYNASIAEEISSKFGKLKSNQAGSGVSHGGSGVSPANPPVGTVTNWTKFKTAIKGMTRTKTFKYLAAAGGTYLAWKWYTSKGATPLPQCITKGSSEEDFKKMNDEGLEYAIVTKTGNPTIDENGGGIFYDNGDFKTGNRKYEGSWEEEDDEGVIMTIEGTSYPMSCEEIVDDTETEDIEDTEDEGGVITYRSCSSAPFDLGCINNDIKFVQSCLGIEPVDGKLSPITKSGIENAGYSVPLTQSDLDKIKEKCGGTTTTTTIPRGPNNDTEYSDEV